MCTISPGLLLCRLVPHIYAETQDSRASFSKLSRWFEDARALASPHLVTVLVGNKSDREEEREVEWAEASRWAAEHGEHKRAFYRRGRTAYRDHNRKMCTS